MKINDMPKFTLMLASLGELYSKNISELLTDVYWQALKDFELQDVEKALQAHIHNPDCGQYFPKPADVVRFIVGSGETRALTAWTMVEKAIHQVGGYQSIVFDDPLINAVLEDMGGWVKLCSTTLRELPFRANEFQKRYMGFVIKKPERHPKYLVGITETDNAKNGFEISPALLIGDPKKAEEVIKSGGGTALLVKTFTQSIAEIMQHPFVKDQGNNE